MGKRYIEGKFLKTRVFFYENFYFLLFLVFAATKAEMDYVTSHTGAKQKKISAGGRKDLIVRLRGLPYGCSEDDIEKFFSGKFRNSWRFSPSVNSFFALQDCNWRRTEFCSFTTNVVVKAANVT